MENRTKTWIWVVILILGIVFAIVMAIYTYNRGSISDVNIVNTQKLAEVENQENSYNEMMNEVVETSSTNTNISPNAVVIQKRYYKGCDHLLRETVEIPEELINQDENSLKEYYSDWKVEQYSPTEIVIYKEFKGICNEHYVIKEHNGVLGIFVENDEKVQEWQEDTEIEVQYLPEEDIEEFKVGVRVVGKMNLITFLEDYE